MPKTKNTVTKEHIESLMSKAKVMVQTIDNKTTLVHMTLENGWTIDQTSSCVDPANYDEELGKSICLKRIADELWKLEGYKLQCELYAQKLALENACDPEGMPPCRPDNLR